MVVDTSTAGLLYILASVILPIVVAFVTKQNTLGKYKAITLLALAAVTSFVFQWQEYASGIGDVDLSNAAVGTLVSFIIAAATHYGFWKPTEVTGSTGVVAEKTANVGI